jgi:hypothetical protein
MIMNVLTGKLQLDMDDVALEVQKNAMRIGRYKLSVVEDTLQGFTLEPLPPQSLCMPGLYGIYRHNKLLYFGSSTDDMHYRISRFIKEVRGLSRLDEGHAAGKKYREMWGSNLDDVEIMFCPYINTKDSYPMGTIEAYLIQKLKPLLNTRRGFPKKNPSKPKRNLELHG